MRDSDIGDQAAAPSGIFVMNIWRRDVLVGRWAAYNLIVDGAKAVQARLLGGDVTNRSITKIGFGTSGTAPAGGNTGLTGGYLKALDGVSYPTAGQVQFAWSLLNGEANGMAILEFGLFTGGNTLFARKVRAAALNKDSDLALSGTWTITY